MKKDDPWHRFARMFTAEGMDESLRRTFIGRAISMVSFIMVILCLGLWVTVFSLWRDNSLVNSIAPKILSNLMCFGFFGGLVFAVIIGGLVGNTLRRVLWKMLVKREKQ